MRAAASATALHARIIQAARHGHAPERVQATAPRLSSRRPPHSLAVHTRARAAGGPPCSAAWSDGSSSSSGGSSSGGWLLDVGTPASARSASSSAGGSEQQYDAVMVLGGGLNPDASLPEWVVRRLEGALHLYRQQLAARPATGAPPPPPPARWPAPTPGAPPIVLLGAATPHKPPVLDARGYVLYESSAYASWLLRRGVPAADLLKETQSCDTVGNAYFSLLQHALPAGWRRIAVVTSEFHMPRTAATFDFVYRLAGRQLAGDADWYRLDYRAVSDEGIFDAEVIEARAAKEAAAVAAWHRNTAAVGSLADLHGWLYATHLCYSVARQDEFGRDTGLDPRLAATY